jgi:hypothetical protein
MSRYDWIFNLFICMCVMHACRRTGSYVFNTKCCNAVSIAKLNVISNGALVFAAYKMENGTTIHRNCSCTKPTFSAMTQLTRKPSAPFKRTLNPSLEKTLIICI